MSETPTPRTTAAKFHRDSGEYPLCEYVADYRDVELLERELTAARAELAQVRAEADAADKLILANIRDRDAALAELAALKAKASGTDWINAVTPPSPTRAEVVSDRYLTLDPWGGLVRILTFVHATQEWTENGDDTQRVAWYAPLPAPPRDLREGGE
jgi:hypothetical protein